MSRIYCLIAVLCFLTFDIQAQKKGKPDLKRYKNTLKKAKKGDLMASLKIAEVCKGHILASDAEKDYTSAKKWYSSALATKSDPNGRGSFGMFSISLTGGYGETAHMEEAKKWHQQAVANGAFRNNETYLPALDLADFFMLYEKAKTDDDFAKLQLARMYFEFGIHYRKARGWLKSLVEAGNQEAIYLDEKWKASQNRYHSYRESKIHHPVLFYLLEKHAKAGSAIAKLEWIETALQADKDTYRLSDEKVHEILADFQTDIPELQFKMLFIRQQYEAGIQKYTTIREMTQIKHQLSDVNLQFAQGALQEFRMVDAKLKTISDLGTLFRQSQTMNEVNLDVVAYRNHFEGEIRPLVALQKELSTSEMRAFLGAENYKILKEELNQKVNQIMEVASNSPMLLMTIREGFMKSIWLRGIYYPHNQGILNHKLANVGITNENMTLYEQMHQLERVRFQKLEDARRELYQIDAKAISPEDKLTLKSFIKTKGIRDVIGTHPKVETIEQNKHILLSSMWLQPEGAQEYFRYTSDSKNWFSGDVPHPKMAYHYIIKAKPTKGKYQLIINGIRAEKSQLVYSSSLEITAQKEADSYVVKLFLSERPKYKWEESSFDYLKVVYPATGSQFAVQSIGKIKKKEDNLHGKSELELTKKARRGDFSEKNALRSAVEYFIRKYNKALHIF